MQKISFRSMPFLLEVQMMKFIKLYLHYNLSRDILSVKDFFHLTLLQMKQIRKLLMVLHLTKELQHKPVLELQMYMFS